MTRKEKLIEEMTHLEREYKDLADEFELATDTDAEPRLRKSLRQNYKERATLEHELENTP